MPCNQPGTGGNECEAFGDLGEKSYYCPDRLQCSFADDFGDCSNCGIRNNDGSGHIVCPEGGVCAATQSGSLQCPAGNCEVTTPGYSGSCAAGSLCELNQSFTCESDPSGNGCSGTFNNGNPVSCPLGEQCRIYIDPTLLLIPAQPTLAQLDFRKRTVNGDGIFIFPVRLAAEILEEPLSSIPLVIPTSPQTALAPRQPHASPRP